MGIIYTAAFVDSGHLKQKYPQVHPNAYYHHCTIEFRPPSLEGFPLGQKVNLKITGRLTTDNVDLLLVDCPMSTNLHPHITLSVADGIKPYQSNSEIVENPDKVEPLDDSVRGIYGYFDGKDVLTSASSSLNEMKERFYQILKPKYL